MRIIRKLSSLFIVFCCLSASAGNYAQVAYVFTKKSFIWTEPGYTWRDCYKLENQPDSFSSLEQLNKVKDICAQRPVLLNAGDKVFIQPDGKGGKLFETHDIEIGGKVQPKKFYFVSYDKRDDKGNLMHDKNGQPLTYRGWMSEDQFTTIGEDEPEVPAQLPSKKIEPPCPPAAAHRPVVKNPITEAKKSASQMSEIATNNNLALGHIKSDAELDRFMCLYRNANISDKDFPAHLQKFKASAEQASKSFHVPYGALMCTLLIESGLHYDPRERDEYKGYGQFGSALIDDIGDIAKRTPYKQELASYKERFPATSLTDDNVRSSADPTHAVAAAALSLQWIYEDRIPASHCKDCSRNGQLNRRDLYLLVGGYNYGPYSIQKYANRSLAAMKTSYPPPEESRNYMTQMDRCLEKDQETQFRVDSRNVSREYSNTSRKKFCDQTYPK